MKPSWVHALRVFLGVVFVSAGASKLGPYPSLIGPVHLVDQLEPYGLQLFGQFIAISEMGIGLLLLTRRFATVGAIMLVPMLLCILAFTISLQWQGTPWIVAIMLLFNLALLAHDRGKWAGLIAGEADFANDPEAPKRGALVRAWPLILAALLLLPLLAARTPMLFRTTAFFGVSCLLLTGLILMDRRSPSPA